MFIVCYQYAAWIHSAVYCISHSHVPLASSPGHSCLLNVARREGWGPGTRTHVRDANTCHTVRSERLIFEAARFRPQIMKGWLLARYLLVKWSHYNRLYASEPYFWSATNGSAHKTADLWLVHTHQTFCLYLLYLLSICDVAHVTLRTRPSPFSACNIEKAGVAWGWG